MKESSKNELTVEWREDAWGRQIPVRFPNIKYENSTKTRLIVSVAISFVADCCLALHTAIGIASENIGLAFGVWFLTISFIVLSIITYACLTVSDKLKENGS